MTADNCESAYLFAGNRFRIPCKSAGLENDCALHEGSIPNYMSAIFRDRGKLGWFFVSIAPSCRDHRIAFRLKDNQGGDKAVGITDISILGWLPGEKNVSVKFKLPKDLKKGNYMLEMGVVFHSAIDHTIPIANKEETGDE